MNAINSKLQMRIKNQYMMDAMLVQIVKWIFISISFFASIYISCVGTMPKYYDFLFLLPFIYGLCVFISTSVLKEALQSFPVLLIVMLFFVRMVLSPFLYAFAGVKEQMTIGVEENTIKAIFMVCYECIAVFFTLIILSNKYCRTRQSIKYTEFSETQYGYKRCKSMGSRKGDMRLVIFLILCVAIIVVFYFITPHIFDTFRTILSITDKDFASIETNYSNIDTSSFVVKFALVTSNYMLNVMRLLIPAAIIYFSSKSKHRLIASIVAIIAVLSPMFIIAGAIARSVYYVIILMYEFVYLFTPKNQNMKMIAVFICGAILILVYWIIRYIVGEKGEPSIHGFLSSFSGTINAYFSGVNVVTGIFNLPNDIGSKIGFLLKDIFGSIPYSGTIFGIEESEKIQPVFNAVNNVSGNIPPTIGISYYYFGPLLSPLLSVLFTIVGYKCGLLYDISKRPIKKAAYQLIGLYCALGLVMYNFPISLGNIVQGAVVILIIERLCYGKERQ